MRIGELGWNPTVQHVGETQMEMDSLKEMVLGRPAPLVSTFRLSYYTILNLMSRAEGQFTAEHVIRNSFHQFQYEKALPDMGNKISKLEDEAARLDASGEAVVAEYHKLKLDIVELEKKMMAEITRPERVLYFLLPGRLVKVREGGTDWGWGVVLNVVKKPPAVLGSLPPALSSTRGISYIVDTLLHCSLGSSENGSRPKPSPPLPGEKGEMHVVPVQLPLISALSKLRISVPSDLRPIEARKNILLAVQELEKRFPQGLPKLNPVKSVVLRASGLLIAVQIEWLCEDMGIEEPEFVELVNQIEELDQKLFSHPLHKLQKFRDELKNRSRVLKKLGHIDADGVVQLKGRAACLIDTGDELLVTELMFNGTFNDLDHHQIAALASCFIPVDKSSEQIQLRAELAKPLQQLQNSARRIAEIQHECKLEVNVDEYVEAAVRPYLMDVIYCWSKGVSFAEVIQMTDIFEGSIIRLARRLDEFLNQDIDGLLLKEITKSTVVVAVPSVWIPLMIVALTSQSCHIPAAEVQVIESPSQNYTNILWFGITLVSSPSQNRLISTSQHPKGHVYFAKNGVLLCRKDHLNTSGPQSHSSLVEGIAQALRSQSDEFDENLRTQIVKVANWFQFSYGFRGSASKNITQGTYIRGSCLISLIHQVYLVTY
ncbi:hypothetical protein RHGRI_009303 [Rhododendron griersonianum]|uniref:ATP-dependent RNA helicase Ski2/MTR4 C-terminal domain-containing protein n=1 Tax=Rhododendron griersonianum TaxID=479676 RepID=A0AAV6L432_9ERIC|nr:hypothetical protein RHGRI_009303 [Rhododendron griersonianum]